MHAVRQAAGWPVRRALIAAACCATALAAAGCGGTSSSSAAARSKVQPIPLATFNCGQWGAARPDIRQTVLDELHHFYGGPVSGHRRTKAYGTVLTDEQATQLFDSYCAQSFAGNFTLYKLYARSAAFGGGAP
jgi:Spy/CpxP family protein refolding chaperone